MTGTIKTLVPDRGFGFITLVDGTDVFFHATALAGVGPEFALLHEGDPVECDVDLEAPRGPRATRVRRPAA